MTYRDLLGDLEELTDTQLDMDVKIFSVDINEFRPASGLDINYGEDDDGMLYKQPFLIY